MAAKRLKIEKASDVLKYKEDDIKARSKEEWLYNMEKGRANNFGWQKDKYGQYRDMFLRKNIKDFLSRYYRIKSLKKSEVGKLYRVRLKG